MVELGNYLQEIKMKRFNFFIVVLIMLVFVSVEAQAY